MKKKSWISLLVLMMLTGLLAACGGSKDEPAASPSSASPSASPSASESSPAPESSPAAAPVKLRFLTHGTETQYNWEETVAAFTKEYPNIQVEVVGLSEKGDSTEALQKLDLAAAAGDQMDVLMFSDPTSYAKRVSLGMVAPIDEFIDKEGYKEPDDYKVNTQLNGQYYALPGKFNPWYVLLNKDHLDAANLQVPKDWTWDEFADFAKKLTTKNHFGTYFHGPQGGGWFEYLKLYMANQADNTDLLKADGSSNLDDPNFRKTLELRVKMEREDKSAVTYADMLSQKLHYRTQFFNQSASMILIGSWMNSEIGGTEANPLSHHVAVAPWPKNDAGDATGVTSVTTDFMAVAAKSDHKEEAYTFIRWYTTKGLANYGRNIPSWNGVSKDELASIVEKIVSETKNPELVDQDSLINTLLVSSAGGMYAPPSYQAEVYRAVNEEYELMILGKQDIDTALKNMQAATQKIIDANK